jgi:hypothetical protein
MATFSMYADFIDSTSIGKVNNEGALQVLRLL